MAQRAGRVGVNPADVNPVTGHVNVEVPGNVYTKTQVDNKFLSKTKAASDYQTKNLAVPIELLDGSALTVETALQGLNSQKQDKELAVPIHMLDGTKLTVETALQGLNTVSRADVSTEFTKDTSNYRQTRASRQGNIVVVELNITGINATAQSTVVATIPEGYRPNSNMILPVIEAGEDKFANVFMGSLF